MTFTWTWKFLEAPLLVNVIGGVVSWVLMNMIFRLARPRR